MIRFKQFFLAILWLCLALFCHTVKSAVTNTEEIPQLYLVERVFDAQNRSKIAQTGALILEVGHADILVEATTAEQAAITQLGFSATRLTQNKARAKQLVKPPAESAYHNYAEMVTEIQQTEAKYPAIFKLFNLGMSAEGRVIWLGKISDNVGRDEAEPEVLLTHHQHAREHITVEQGLYTLRLLTEGYQNNVQIKRLVNNREIWLIFDMNPDGGEYDIASGFYRSWRKNRQLHSKSKMIGIDLNRNWGYLWDCCDKGSGSKPNSETYHGETEFSAPETKVVRDFVNSRVLKGQQQIKVAIDFHSYSESVMWPYSHTLTNVPVDMTTDDQAVLVAMGKKMAAMSKYKAMQWSDLYIADGTLNDWLYGMHGIFNYTFEMYPKTNTQGGFYPPDNIIAQETARNRNAILYLITQAACPYSSIGKQGQYCDTASTGFLHPSNDMAVTQGGGDNNGYDVNPFNAYTLQKSNAIDMNSGSNNSTACHDQGKDKHDFYDYFIDIPMSATVKGIEVKLHAKVDSVITKPYICVQLSWDSGINWTIPKLTKTLSTGAKTYLLGGALDTWGHIWRGPDLDNSNFKVRLTNVAGSTARDFYLDWVTVKVRY